MPPTRQVVRLAEVHNLVRRRLDFSAGFNRLVGFTNAKGEYVIKSDRSTVAVIREDGTIEATLEDANEYHVPHIKRSLALVKGTQN